MPGTVPGTEGTCVSRTDTGPCPQGAHIQHIRALPAFARACVA